MIKKYNFAINQKEYKEFLAYQLLIAKQFKGVKWFLITSIPVVLITLMILLKINDMVYRMAILALCAIWVLYGHGVIFTKYIKEKSNKMYDKLQVKKFNEVKYEFKEMEVVIYDKKVQNVAYKNINSITPLKNIMLLNYNGGSILLPYRVIKEENLKDLVKIIEKNRIS